MAKIEEKIVLAKTGDEVRLRSPDKTDAQSMIDYCHQVFATSPYLITQADEYRQGLNEQEKWIDEMASSPGSVCLIAESIHPPSPEIHAILDICSRSKRRRIRHRGTLGMSLAKNWRGKGIGRQLLATAIDWARSPSSTLEKIELVVLEENAPAFQLYQSLGFKEEGRTLSEVKLDDGRYLDGIQMGLFLEKWAVTQGATK